MFFVPVTCAEIPPYCRVEQYEEWKQLKTSGKHVKHKDIFGQNTKAGEVLCRSHQFKTRTDIVDGGGNCRKIRYQVFAFQGYGED